MVLSPPAITRGSSVTARKITVTIVLPAPPVQLQKDVPLIGIPMWPVFVSSFTRNSSLVTFIKIDKTRKKYANMKTQIRAEVQSTSPCHLIGFPRLNRPDFRPHGTTLSSAIGTSRWIVDSDSYFAFDVCVHCPYSFGLSRWMTENAVVLESPCEWTVAVD